MNTTIIEQGARIGQGTQFGHFTHVLSGAQIGVSCVIGDNVTIGNDVVIGDNVWIGNGVSFAGMEARGMVHRKDEIPKTVVENNVTIGSNVVVVGNTKIKEGAKVADGSVVIGYVYSKTFIGGNPARRIYSLSALNGNF